MPPRGEPSSWTSFRKPERELGDVVLEYAAPLLEPLGPQATEEDLHRAMELAVEVWNATLLASKILSYPKPKDFNALKKRMEGKQASKQDAEIFEVLRARRSRCIGDLRLVKTWQLDKGATGDLRLQCTVELPYAVEMELPPAAEKRISVSGRFLDEVRIATTTTSFVQYRLEHHHFRLHEDGDITIVSPMATVLQLFAEGVLLRLQGEPVAIAVGGRKPQLMVLATIRQGEGRLGATGVLTFRPVQNKSL
jgi:hypothetical protein